MSFERWNSFIKDLTEQGKIKEPAKKPCRDQKRHKELTHIKKAKR